MEQNLNYPIQMVCAFSTQGDIKPLRFKYEDPEHQIITVDVDNVIARKEMTIGKGGSLIFNNAAGKNSPISIGGEMNFRPGSGIFANSI